MSCKRHRRGVTVHYFGIGSRYPARVLRCSYCRRIVPIGPSADFGASVWELEAIDVVAGERAALGQTSPAFRVGLHEGIDPKGWHPGAAWIPSGHADSDRAWLQRYQSGAFAAHLIDEEKSR